MLRITSSKITPLPALRGTSHHVSKSFLSIFNSSSNYDKLKIGTFTQISRFKSNLFDQQNFLSGIHENKYSKPNALTHASTSISEFNPTISPNHPTCHGNIGLELGLGRSKFQKRYIDGFPSSAKKAEQFSTNQEHSTKRIVSALFSYVWPPNRPDIRSRVVFSMGLLVASKLLNVSVPFIFKGIIDSLAVAGVSTYILAPAGMVLMYGAARAGAALFNELRNAVFSNVSLSSSRVLALNIFNHLHKMDLEFHLSRKTGGLSSVIDRGKRGVNFILSSLVFNVVPTFFELGVVCTLLYLNMGPEFAVTAFAAVLAYTVFTMTTTTWRTKFRKEMNREEADAAQKVIDSLINYETVKYFGNEKHEFQRYEHHLKKYEASSLKTQHSLAFLNAGQNFIFSAAITAMMYMTLGGIGAGTMTVGDMVMVNGLLFQLSIPLNFLGSVYREISQAITDMENMFGLMDTKSKVQSEEKAPPLMIKNGEIEFRDVSFSYESDRKILSHISFVAPAGSTIGIVGPSGSGKSTVLRLLFRFFDPNSGNIYIDGQDISKVSTESLRSVIGVVPQDTVLFNETLGYNIRYGNLNATDQEVEEAIDRAMLRDLINRLPKGLNTQCGERGLMLSGGEKQRVALARSILKKPKILLCDESTSSLDTQTERKIMDSIQEVSKGCTTITIAHRLSTVKDSDTILVFGPNGQIAESGTHEDLLSKHGIYYELWKKQSEAPESTVEETFEKTPKVEIKKL